MRILEIPRTSLKASQICLGTGSLGSVVSKQESFALLDQYLAAGGNFIDTARVYADWLPGERSVSEKTIGRWLVQSHKRDQVILSTKGAHPPLDRMHESRLSQKELQIDLDGSLESLQTDVIDLYWLHRDDENRPVGEIIENLEHHVTAGKIRYYGCSNWRVERIKEANAFAQQRGMQGFVGNQLMWSLAAVEPGSLPDPTMICMDPETRQFHLESGMAVMAYSSQAGGWFQKLAAGKLEKPLSGVYANAENQSRFSRIERVMVEMDLSLTQVILGYLLSQPLACFPIVGCRTLPQLEDSLSAADVLLPEDTVHYLEEG